MWKSASAMGSDTSSLAEPPPLAPLPTMVSPMGGGGGEAISMVLSLSPPADSLGCCMSTVLSSSDGAGAAAFFLRVRVVEDEAWVSSAPLSTCSCFIQSAPLMRAGVMGLEDDEPLRFLIMKNKS